MAHFRRCYLEYEGAYDDGWRKGSELFLMYPGGRWEVYTRNAEFGRKMQIAEQVAAQDRESAGATSPPMGSSSSKEK